jgi:NAD(P)-dependent dehydrogenase (short-subunit alcohol dehydrogenase family)
VVGAGRQRSMDLELAGKVVIVTGGSDGLGRALCAGLVAEGARVVAAARTQETLTATVDAITAAGGEAIGVVTDVTRPDDLSHLVTETVERWGRIDGLVNNAGRSAAKPVEAITDEEWDDDLTLKLFAATRLIRLALPHLRRTQGSIVNVLAVSAKAPSGSSAPSSVSRAAGMAMTKALSREVGADGIRVNAVLIGLIESGQWDRQAEAAGRSVDELYRRMGTGSDIPLGRVGRAAEFADLVAYLLSARASYVTGTAINLDGGLSPAV